MRSTDRGTTRQLADRYLTPYFAIDAILREIDWAKISSVLEPACGDRRIIDAIKLRKTDLYIDWAEINPMHNAPARNFLTSADNRKFDLVITNPPFTTARDFIDKSLSIGNSVTMLLRLGFLCSQQRHTWWQDKPPSHLFTLAKRPSFTKRGTDSTDYAWYGWGQAFLRPPGIYSVI